MRQDADTPYDVPVVWVPTDHGQTGGHGSASQPFEGGLFVVVDFS